MKTINNLKGKQGFTLVELLVSVAIFALVISPLLHAFITAGHTSRRSHFLGDATLAANNIIETIRAGGAEEYLRSLPPDTLDVYTPGMGFYTFDLMGEKVGESRFNIRVMMNASVFRCGNDNCDSSCGEINCMSITDYSPMDGVYVQPDNALEDPDILAANYLQMLANNNGLTLNAADNMTREIILRTEIVDNTRMIYAIYRYTLGSLEPLEMYPEHIYSGRATDTDGKAIYVFFRPLPFRKDTIIIENNAGINLSLFLINQSVMHSAPDIYQNEPHIADIFSNFDYLETRFTGGIGMLPEPKPARGLVPRSLHDRMFRITVEVFAADTEPAPGVRPLMRTIATHLD